MIVEESLPIVDDGIIIDSKPFDNLSSAEGRKAVIEHLSSITLSLKSNEVIKV